MKILITGAAGFLGQRLARQLLRQGALRIQGQMHTIAHIDLLDRVPANTFGDARANALVGDMADAGFLHTAIAPDTAVIFHLAAVVSGQAEEDFDLGMRINLDASRALLERCRALKHAPVVVFTSSVAVYGGALPEVVTDDTALLPQSSYGMQKAVAELLLHDYARRGFVDGRILRLPTISVRPGLPNAAASSFASGMVREPLNGQDAICPVPANTRLWLLSPRRAVQCLVAGAQLDGALLGQRRALNLPGVSVSAAQMHQSLREVAGEAVAARVHWQEDARISGIVATWPGRWDVTRAHSLGLEGDASFADIIRAYMADDLTGADNLAGAAA